MRPLLEFSRAELRVWLTANGHAWLEDPMNDDPGFDRVKMRRVLCPVLEDAGLSAARIAAGCGALVSRPRGTGRDDGCGAGPRKP